MCCQVWFQNRRAKWRKKEHTKKGPGRPPHNAHPQTCSGEPIPPDELARREREREERKRRKQEDRLRKLEERKRGGGSLNGSLLANASRGSGGGGGSELDTEIDVVNDDVDKQTVTSSSDDIASGGDMTSPRTDISSSQDNDLDSHKDASTRGPHDSFDTPVKENTSSSTHDADDDVFSDTSSSEHVSSKDYEHVVTHRSPFSIDSLLEQEKVPRGRRPNSKYPRVQASKSMNPLAFGMLPIFPPTQPMGFQVHPSHDVSLHMRHRLSALMAARERNMLNS